MSSPCLARPSTPARVRVGRAAAFAAAFVGAASLAGCKKPPPSGAPSAQGGPVSVAVSTLFPGGGQPPPPNPQGAAYEHDPGAIADGKRMFAWYNCNGCHFNGGGGIGPALMDDKWIYGGRMDQIYASIAQGRPNGMPSWGGKLTDDQIWKLAAYVKSLSAPGNAALGGPKQATPMPPAPPMAARPPSAHPNMPAPTERGKTIQPTKTIRGG